MMLLVSSAGKRLGMKMHRARGEQGGSANYRPRSLLFRYSWAHLTFAGYAAGSFLLPANRTKLISFFAYQGEYARTSNSYSFISDMNRARFLIAKCYLRSFGVTRVQMTSSNLISYSTIFFESPELGVFTQVTEPSSWLKFSRWIFIFCSLDRNLKAPKIIWIWRRPKISLFSLFCR